MSPQLRVSLALRSDMKRVCTSQEIVGGSIAFGNVDNALCQQVVWVDHVHYPRHLYVQRLGSRMLKDKLTSIAIW